MWADTLTEEEVRASLEAAVELRGVDWAGPLLRRTRDIVDRLLAGVDDREAYRANPLPISDHSLLFELRFARELLRAGAGAQYEFRAGVGNSDVDFKVDADRPWLVELVSLRESEGVRSATRSDGVRQSLVLRTGADDPKHTEESEMLAAQRRIGAKAFGGGRPIKFPEPSEFLHAIVVDARGYLGAGSGDWIDWMQIAAGPDSVTIPELVKSLRDRETGAYKPIRGLFEAACPLEAAATVQARVHFIFFVCERTFAPGEIAAKAFAVGNTELLGGAEKAKAAFRTWPLRRSENPPRQK
jgi:hypothetical protein